ncbi:MAG: ribonuclease H [Bacteroidota bacterium]|nr:ribonuclease H [Bacteroidota bacterium]
MSGIIIYTDGSSRGNPGRGGIGVVMISGKHRKEISEGYRHTTNNRMELLAVIRGLEAIKLRDSDVSIYSDSKYVIDSITKGWLYSWAKKPNFAGKKNEDLWRKYLEVSIGLNLRFIWVKGHAGNVENEHCDHLATDAAIYPDRVDSVFENSQDLRNMKFL